VIDGVTGRLVDSEDVGRLADVMRDLLMDPLLRGRLGTNAKVRATGFSWAASTDRVISLMKERDG